MGVSQVAENCTPAHILHLGDGRPVRAKVHEDLGSTFSVDNNIKEAVDTCHQMDHTDLDKGHLRSNLDGHALLQISWNM